MVGQVQKGHPVCGLGKEVRRRLLWMPLSCHYLSLPIPPAQGSLCPYPLLLNAVPALTPSPLAPTYLRPKLLLLHLSGWAGAKVRATADCPGAKAFAKKGSGVRVKG